MSSTTAELEQKLEAMCEQYHLRLRDKLEDFERDWQALTNGSSGGELEPFIRKVHSMAGSGAMYGFAEIGEAARNFVCALDRLNKAGVEPSVDLVGQGNEALRALREVVREGLAKAD